MINLTIDYARCIYCMECVDICVSGALTYNELLNKFNFTSEDCTYCEVCLDLCEPEAIRITGD